jgi:hypothetical protein
MIQSFFPPPARHPKLQLRRTHPNNLPHTTGTTIRKAFKKGTLNGKITSYNKEREYYMIEYEDGDSEELRHRAVERYIIAADTAIDRLIKKTNKIEVTSKNRSTK